MNLIDTHTHLFLPEFAQDYTEVINRAIVNGVEVMVLPNIDAESIAPMLAVCDTFPANCFPTIGLHPTHVNAGYRTKLGELSGWFSKRKFKAIGEVGLDLYWDKTFFNEQCAALETQIDWAREYTLPLILHTRDAYPQMLELLVKNKTEGLYSGVFHSFAGSVDDAFRAIEMGFKIGISGVVTFKNSQLPQVVEHIALEHIVLETDSPYLTPVPKRGQRNESDYVTFVAQKIAEIKQLSVDEVANCTTQNAKLLFQI